MISLIIEVLIVTASVWLLAKKYFATRSFSELILTGFILFFAQIVFVELFLGIIGKLYFGYVFSLHLLILILVLLFSSNRKAQPLAFAKPDSDPFIKSNLLIFAFAVFTAFFLVKGYVNLINPPVCPDSLQFHLSFPAFWIKNGNLNSPFIIFGAMPIINPGSLETSLLSYYPINAQLFFAWFMLPLKNAFLADLGEAPFYIIGIIAVYYILRKYGVSKTTALLSGFLWALIPNIFKQLRNGSQIDVICAVLLLLVVYALLLCRRSFNFKNSLLLGISVGLFAGTKVINLVWIAALVPLICYMLYKGAAERKLSLVKIGGLLGVIAFTVVLFSGYVYIRNYIFTGDPVFPVDLKIFGKTIFSGLLDSSAQRTLIARDDKLEVMNILFKEGLGVQFLALILPFTFLPLIFFRYLKAKFSPLGEYLVLFATPLIMLIFYKAFINLHLMRYYFPYFSFGILTAVIFTTKSRWGNRYLAFVAFISVIASATELAKGYELVTGLLFSLALFIVLIIYKQKLAAFYRSKAFAKLILMVLFLGAFLLSYLNQKYDREEFDRYPSTFSKKESWQRNIGEGWKALNIITKDGARVAYTGREEFYPLFGTKLKNYVNYVSINAKEADPYNKPDGLSRRTWDFQAWKMNLKKERIEYLFIALPFFNNRESEDPNKFPIEDEWIGMHPEEFQLVFSNPLARIYKVSIK
jgi:hypothetical protein